MAGNQCHEWRDWRGRKATMTNSFCEVSLQPYGVFTHRHQPEIASHLGCDVILRRI